MFVGGCSPVFLCFFDNLKPVSYGISAVILAITVDLMCHLVLLPSYY